LTDAPANDNNHHTIISIRAVCDMTSLSRTAISKFRAAGKFPAEVALGERRIGFVRAEVMAWIEERINARKAA
jgi:prophage regulatory protein